MDPTYSGLLLQIKALEERLDKARAYGALVRQAHDQLLRELEGSCRSQAGSQVTATARSGSDTPKASSVLSAPGRTRFNPARDSLGGRPNAIGGQTPFSQSHVMGRDSAGPGQDAGGVPGGQKLGTPCASTCAHVQVGMSPVERHLQSVASRTARPIVGAGPPGVVPHGSPGVYSATAGVDATLCLSTLPSQGPVLAPLVVPDAPEVLGGSPFGVGAEELKPAVQYSNLAAVQHATPKTSPHSRAQAALPVCPDTEVTAHLSCIRGSPLGTPQDQAPDVALVCPPTIKSPAGSLLPDPLEQAAWVPVVVSPGGADVQTSTPGTAGAPPAPTPASPPPASQADGEQQQPCSDMPPSDMELDMERGQPVESAKIGDGILEGPMPGTVPQAVGASQEDAGYSLSLSHTLSLPSPFSPLSFLSISRLRSTPPAPCVLPPSVFDGHTLSKTDTIASQRSALKEQAAWSHMSCATVLFSMRISRIRASTLCTKHESVWLCVQGE